MMSSICICGAGTMGSGIAQVAAQSGFDTILFDLDETVLEKSKVAIHSNLQRLAQKQKIAEAEIPRIVSRINFTTNIRDCKSGIIIEAIAESTEAKAALFNQLSGLNEPSVIFASNTSSLRISEIQQKISLPQQLAGMHFFNPAPLMKLVEVVKGEMTTDEVATTIFSLAEQMGKTPVMCKDAPGFIVNRVARHYYLEAMKLVEEKAATVEQVDTIMESAGFKMGPFKLMDLIGMDINLSVSQGIYDAFGKVERFKPSPLQIEKVKKGELGRKSNKGFYDYVQA
jgi:3-hydroxybutyryl-CoA dehydrogenase